MTSPWAMAKFGIAEINMNPDIRILVTGATGYIGSVLVPQLLNEGYNVTAIDNFLFDQQSLLDCCYNDRLTIIRGDCNDGDLLKKCMKDIDFMIPLAAYVGTPACDKFPTEASATNLDAIKLLLHIREKINKERENNKKKNLINIIFPATNAGYGKGFCTEETPMNPVSLYGKLKFEAEQLILDSGNSISLRLAAVMGCSPSMRFDSLVNDLVYKALTDKYVELYEPNAKRNMIHVKDVCKTFIHCIENWDEMKNNIYNVGLSNANLSKMELCQEIKKQIPDFTFKEIEGCDPDKRDYIVSNEKLENTGWKADYSLQDTIKELIKCYQIVRKMIWKHIEI